MGYPWHTLHTFEDGIALILTHINQRLQSLGYPDEVWLDYNEQLRINRLARRQFLEQH